jgi:hypothetical protein
MKVDFCWGVKRRSGRVTFMRELALFKFLSISSLKIRCNDDDMMMMMIRELRSNFFDHH